MRQTTRPMALFLSLFLTACGSSQPAGPTTPSPAPSPTPAPNPTPNPNPTPTPYPTPPPTGAPKCTLARSDGRDCGKETLPNGHDRSNYYGELQRAQRQVRDTRPELFNGHEIKNDGLYMAAVILTMLSYGYCAELGPSGDEISLKIRTNTYSEVYDIIFAEGRSSTTDYKYTCRPAHF